jgi:hypothetical protein
LLACVRAVFAARRRPTRNSPFNFFARSADKEAMSQISRPFQIALLAVAVLAAAWLFVFQQHPSTSSSSSSSSPVVSSAAPAPSSAAAAKAKAAASAKIYHGSAPGVEGLSRAIAHAHGAVSTSQQNANNLETKSAQASGEAASTHSASSAASATKSAATPAKSAPASKSTSAAATKSHTPQAAGTTHAHTSSPAGQHAVETELAHGNVVVVLFWNPNGADDEVVHRELMLLRTIHHKVAPYAKRPLVKRLLKAFGLELDKKIAINVASANQTASFGSITRGIQVYGTPTMLVIDKHGHAIVLNGLQDAFSIEQAIDEARHVA